MIKVPIDLAMRDMDAAAATIAYCNQATSECRQLGFATLASYHRDNSKAAERWLVKAGQAYPRCCDARTRPTPHHEGAE